MKGAQKRKPIDPNRLSTALARVGIHSFQEVGEMFGYNKGWLVHQVAVGSVNSPMLKALEQLGIGYNEIMPLPDEHPIGRETVANMEPDAFFKELYRTMYVAVRDALRGENEQ